MKTNRVVLAASYALLSATLTGCVFGSNEQYFEISKLSAAVPSLLPDSSPVPAQTPMGPVAVSTPDPTPVPVPSSTPNSDLCIQNPTAAACNKAPVVSAPGVVTILFTMSQIPQSAASLILANAIKYASPVVNPKILFLKDYATYGEDEGDPAYIKDTLLKGYNLTYDVIPEDGMSDSSVLDYDIVIVSNPGHPLSSPNTLAALERFKGGVILIGDDLSQGATFSMESLTGLKFENNGTSMSCNGTTYSYDNLGGYNYQITMNEQFFSGIPDADKLYQYGNDLDWTSAIPGTQILATGAAAPGTCDIGQVPAVVRRPKN